MMQTFKTIKIQDKSRGFTLIEILVTLVVLSIGLLGLAALTIPFSLWPGGSLSHVLNLHVKMVIFFLLLVHCVRSLHDVNVTVWGFLGSIAVIELWVLLFNQKVRAQVTSMYDPNDLAFVMVCAIPLAASLAIHGRGIARYLAGLIASAAGMVVGSLVPTYFGHEIHVEPHDPLHAHAAHSPQVTHHGPQHEA